MTNLFKTIIHWLIPNAWIREWSNPLGITGVIVTRRGGRWHACLQIAGKRDETRYEFADSPWEVVRQIFITHWYPNANIVMEGKAYKDFTGDDAKDPFDI